MLGQCTMQGLQGAKSQATVRFYGLQACSAAWLTACNEHDVFTVSVAALAGYPLIKLCMHLLATVKMYGQVHVLQVM
jgi:hypothetical protein